MFEILLFLLKSPSAKAKGLVIVWLPLLDNFRTFKGNVGIENIILNQLINLPV
jgi:hypothetical protein